MIDHRQIYQTKAALYQRLISREDYQGNLLPAIQRITAIKGKTIIDLGTGTGRLARLLAPTAGCVCGFDSSPQMLAEAASVMISPAPAPWLLAAADHRSIPLSANSADLVISGWSLCYLVVWEGTLWKTSLQSGLREIGRLLRQGGTLIVIETLGTGVQEPQVLEKLKAYFNYLEKTGFHHTWIRTDYQFINQLEADQLVEFFFGPDMLPRIQSAARPILPECTGLWWITGDSLRKD